MVALAVGGVMPIGDQPAIHGRSEVRLEPDSHRPVGGAARTHRIQAYKMRHAQIVRVVELGAAGDAAGRAIGGQGEDV